MRRYYIGVVVVVVALAIVNSACCQQLYQRQQQQVVISGEHMDSALNYNAFDRPYIGHKIVRVPRPTTSLIARRLLDTIVFEILGLDVMSITESDMHIHVNEAQQIALLQRIRDAPSLSQIVLPIQVVVNDLQTVVDREMQRIQSAQNAESGMDSKSKFKVCALEESLVCLNILFRRRIGFKTITLLRISKRGIKTLPKPTLTS
jgi:hypothetical protein